MQEDITAGKGSGSQFEVGDLTVKPEEQSPAESFAAMEDEVLEGNSSREVGNPILPCQKPSLELLLSDEDGKPAANIPYNLSLPDGTQRSGKLDDKGYVRIEDIETDIDTVTLKLWREVLDDGTSIYELQLVKLEDTLSEEIEQEEEPEFPGYFIPSYDRFIELEEDDLPEDQG